MNFLHYNFQINVQSGVNESFLRNDDIHSKDINPETVAAARPCGMYACIRVYVCTYKEKRADDEFLRSTIWTNICSCNRKRYYVRGAPLEWRGWQCVILAVTRLHYPVSFFRLLQKEGRIHRRMRAALAGTLCSKKSTDAERYTLFFFFRQLSVLAGDLPQRRRTASPTRPRVQGFV